MKLAYENLIDLIWTEGRPPLSEEPIVVHNLTYAGTGWTVSRVTQGRKARVKYINFIRPEKLNLKINLMWYCSVMGYLRSRYHSMLIATLI